MSGNIAHVVYASDDKFAEILGISLVSLYENSKDMEDIIVYILDAGIKEENKKKLMSLTQKYNAHELVFIEAKDITKELNMKVTLDRGSIGQYARLFISSVLPDDLDKVLYLDCDIILVKSIKELWNLDLQGKIIAALKDAFSKYYRANINLRQKDVMFNSGVMLIDLNKWKEEKIEDKLLKFIVEKNGKVQQGDQGVLNAVLSSDTFCFHPKYNSVTIFYDFSYEEMLFYRKPPEFYSKEVIKSAVDNPYLIHFTTSFLSERPWMVGCQHKYKNEWMKYKEMSPWKDSKLWEDNRPKWKKAGQEIFNKLPRKVAIVIASFMQVYVRPFANKFK